jgi:hypothetical protein
MTFDDANRRASELILRGSTPYSPQIGWMTMSSFCSTVTTLTGIDLGDKVTRHIENLIALFVNIQAQLGSDNCVQGITSAIVLYANTVNQGSLSGLLKEYLEELFLSPQVDGEDSLPPSIQAFKDAARDWKTVMHSPFATHVTQLISLAVSLGLCDLASINFTIGGVKLISEATLPEVSDAANIVDAVLSVTAYFVEAGHLCFKQGSIAPLLLGSSDSNKFSEDFMLAGRCNQCLRTGDMKKLTALDENDYGALLKRLMDTARRFMKSCDNYYDKRYFESRLATLDRWKLAYDEVRTAGRVRMRPGSLGIYGPSGTGKSTMVTKLMVTLLMANGFAADSSRIITLNSRDQYMSNYRSYINGIIVDDVGNTKTKYMSNEPPPSYWYTTLINNVPTYANMADLESKGRVSIEPFFVFWTKNVLDSLANETSNAPMSIASREDFILVPKVRNKYAIGNRLDPFSVPSDTFASGLPDLWLIDVYKAYEVAPRSVTTLENIAKGHVEYRLVHSNLDYESLVNVLISYYRKHFSVQKDVVEAAEGVEASVREVLCQECLILKKFCSCNCSLCKNGSDGCTCRVEPNLVNIDDLPSDDDVPDLDSGYDFYDDDDDNYEEGSSAPTTSSSGSMQSGDLELDPEIGNVPLWAHNEVVVADRFVDVDPIDNVMLLDVYWCSRARAYYYFLTGENYRSSPTGPIELKYHNMRITNSMITRLARYFDHVGDTVSGISTIEMRFSSLHDYAFRRFEEESPGDFAEFQMGLSALGRVLNLTPVDDQKIAGVSTTSKILSWFTDGWWGIRALERAIDVGTSKSMDYALYKFSNSQWGKLYNYIPGSWIEETVDKDGIKQMNPLLLAIAADEARYKHISLFTTVSSMVGSVAVAMSYVARKCPNLRPYCDWSTPLLRMCGISRKPQQSRFERIMTRSGLLDSERFMTPKAAICVLGTSAIFGCYVYYRRVRALVNVMYHQVQQEHASMPETFKRIRDNYLAKGLALSASMYGVWVLVQAYRQHKQEFQGNLAPSSMKVVEEREKEEFVYAVPGRTPLPTNTLTRTMTHEQFVRKIGQNTAYIVADRNDLGKSYNMGCFFVGSNVALIPTHYFDAQPKSRVTFVRKPQAELASKFKAWLDREFAVDIPNTDYSLAYVPSGGDWPSLVEFFPENHNFSLPFTLIHRNGEGVLSEAHGHVVYGPQRVANKSISAGVYTLDVNTFQGLCGAPLVSNTTHDKYILGLHIGGVTNTPKGICSAITRGALNLAKETLSNKPGVLLCHDSGTVYTKQYAECVGDFFTLAGPHPKSPVCYLPEGSNVEFYGETVGRVKPKSQVFKTSISDDVEEIMGISNEWGPPKFNVGYPFQASLAHLANPSFGFPPDLIGKAASDYLRTIIAAIDSVDGLKQSIRPLDDQAVIDGEPGVRYINSMKWQTSLGHPINRPKSTMVTTLPPTEKYQVPHKLHPVFPRVAREMEASYCRNERAYPIYSAFLKDEPTPVIKDKVRVVQAAPMALQLVFRKYYLPIARALSVVPLFSECAVGINPYSDEWEQLVSHVARFGIKRVLAGDYPKYDLRIPIAVTLAAFWVLCKIGEYTGNYCERDLVVMRGVASDTTAPLLGYNGDLIRVFGGNPSGQNLTAYINSIVNSILMRCAFFHEYPGVYGKTLFANCVALMTYGDDLFGSVHRNYPKFHFLTVRDFLEHGEMGFTMPDKVSDPRPLMDLSEVDFLKRKSVYIDELGLRFGALAIKSIFRQLHSLVKGEVHEREQLLSGVDNVMLDLFYHGRTIYDDYRTKMFELVERHPYLKSSKFLKMTFDDRIDMWKKDNPNPSKYDLRYVRTVFRRASPNST